VRWWPIDDLPPTSSHMASRLEAGLADEREARFLTERSRSGNMPGEVP
jgi:hypothetical protein